MDMVRTMTGRRERRMRSAASGSDSMGAVRCRLRRSRTKHHAVAAAWRAASMTPLRAAMGAARSPPTHCAGQLHTNYVHATSQVRTNKAVASPAASIAAHSSKLILV